MKYISENKRLKTICAISVIVSLAAIVLVITKSYAIYKMQEEFDIIKSKIEGYTPGDVEVAVLVDGKEANTFPTYEDNYLVTNIDCTNDVKATWNVENWEIRISDMSATSTKCTVSFDSTKKNEITPINMSKDELVALNEEITNTSAKQLANYLYPVGSIYMSTEDDTVEKVQDKFGGTWVRYATDTTLVGYKDENKEVNSTGGAQTATLSTNNIPAHTHSVTASGSVSSKFSGSRALTESTGSGYSIGYGSSSRTVSSWTGSHKHGADDGGKFVYNHYNQNIGTYSYSFTTVSSGGFNPNANYTADASITVSGQTVADYYANSISGVAAHQHYYTPSGSVSSSFTGTAVNSSSVGSGEAFSIQDPYTIVYMYKRTE